VSVKSFELLDALQTAVSKFICTVGCTTSTSTVMSVVLPRLLVLQRPAIFFGRHCTKHWELWTTVHSCIWCNTSAVSDIRHQTTQGDCHRSKYVTHWITLNSRSRWIFLYSFCTYTRKLNKLWTNFACFKCLHSTQAFRLFTMSHVQIIRPTAVWISDFSTEQHSTVATHIFSCKNIYGITSILCNRDKLKYYNTWNWHV
jgi:hypothetical protein